MGSGIKKSGILWFVDESKSQRRRFELSFASAKKWSSNSNYCVIYKGDLPEGDLEKIPFKGKGERFLAKFNSWKQSPFDQTLFLDNDTVVLRDLSPLFRDDGKVVALPYPNLLSSKFVSRSKVPLHLDEWQNINSGVIVFNNDFVKSCESLFDTYSNFVNSVPGKDQYFISYKLAQDPKRFAPSNDIQVTTTQFAVDHLIKIKSSNSQSKFGVVPLSLILSSYVFHYTQDKELYESLLFANDSFLNAFIASRKQ